MTGENISIIILVVGFVFLVKYIFYHSNAKNKKSREGKFKSLHEETLPIDKNKEHYNTPSQIPVKVYRWYYENRDEVIKNTKICVIEYIEHSSKQYKTLFSNKDGWLVINSEESSLERCRSELYEIVDEFADTFPTTKDYQKAIFNNKPLVQYDEFKKTKTITWSIIGGDAGKYKFLGSDLNQSAIHLGKRFKKELLFTLENHNKNDFIVFRSEYFKLNPNDKIYFLYQDKSVDCFEITEKAYKVLDSYPSYTTTKLQVTKRELLNLSNKKLIKWKVDFHKSQESIEGEVLNDKMDSNTLSLLINKLSREYQELVKQEIDDYKPLVRDQESKTKPINEKCSVYLMHDTSNNYYKIGLSNKPKYREKTLQSEKPTIELIISKEFPKRKLAEAIEKSLHKTYSEKRLRGEWFELSQDDVEDIILTLS